MNHLNGAPIHSAPAFYFQTDRGLQGWSEAIIGRKDLLIAASINIDENERDVRLPQGHRWVNFRTHEVYEGGQVIPKIPTRDRELGDFTLPLLPVLERYSREASRNARLLSETRSYPAINTDSLLRIFPDPEKSEFTHYETDGHTRDYERGAVRTTKITQQQPANKYESKLRPHKAPKWKPRTQDCTRLSLRFKVSRG